MALRPRPKAAQVHAIADRLRPQARGAFLRAMEEQKASANLTAFLRALEAGDREGAILALKLGNLPKSLARVVGHLDTVFEKTGVVSAAQFKISFSLLNPQALADARKNAARFVVETSASTQAGIRAAIARSFAEGIAPKDVARLLRPMIGLTDRMAQAVINFRGELITGGTAEEAASSQAARYSARLLNRRAETIARTEIIDASAAGQLAGWQAAADAGLLDVTRTQREWIVTDDDRLCELCQEMDGQKVAFDSPFIAPDGGAIDGPTLHPNCRCTVGLAF